MATTPMNPTRNFLPALARAEGVCLPNAILEDLFTGVSRDPDTSRWMLEASQ